MDETRYVLGVEIIQNHPKMDASKHVGMILDLHSESIDTPVKKSLTLSLVRYPKTDYEIDNVPCASV